MKRKADSELNMNSLEANQRVYKDKRMKLMSDESDDSLCSDDLKDICRSGTSKKKLEEIKDLLNKKNPYKTPVQNNLKVPKIGKNTIDPIEETKEIDIDCSIGQISISDLSSIPSGKGLTFKENDKNGATEIITTYANRNINTENLEVTNELFTVISYEDATKSKVNKGLKIMKATLESK